MSIQLPLVIEATDISIAWSKAILEVFAASRGNAGPILLSIHRFDGELPPESREVRSLADRAMSRFHKVPIAASAMTIFPFAAWNRRGRPNCLDFSSLCVDRLLPRLKRLDQRNRLGTYFERMMAYTGWRAGQPRTVNQLHHVIELLRNPTRWPRESAIQIACFDPAKDHTRQPVRGFPCLQQVGIAHDGDESIAVNAFYPTQYVFDRGYGNYLGLCHLGAFLAHESDLRFARLNCYIGRPDLGDVSKAKLRPTVRQLERMVGE